MLLLYVNLLDQCVKIDEKGPTSGKSMVSFYTKTGASIGYDDNTENNLTIGKHNMCSQGI